MHLVAVFELDIKFVLEDDQIALALLVFHLGLEGLGNGVQKGASLDGILLREKSEPKSKKEKKDLLEIKAYKQDEKGGDYLTT